MCHLRFCLRSAPACESVVQSRGEFEELDSEELEMKGGSVGVESDGILAWSLGLGFG